MGRGTLIGVFALAWLFHIPSVEASTPYEIRSAAVAIDANGLVRVYVRLNRELPFRADEEDASSTPWVRAWMNVARTRSYVAMGVLRRARRQPGTRLPITLRVEGRRTYSARMQSSSLPANAAASASCAARRAVELRSGDGVEPSNDWATAACRF